MWSMTASSVFRPSLETPRLTTVLTAAAHLESRDAAALDVACDFFLS